MLKETRFIITSSCSAVLIAAQTLAATVAYALPGNPGAMQQGTSLLQSGGGRGLSGMNWGPGGLAGLNGFTSIGQLARGVQGLQNIGAGRGGLRDVANVAGGVGAVTNGLNNGRGGVPGMNGLNPGSIVGGVSGINGAIQNIGNRIPGMNGGRPGLPGGLSNIAGGIVGGGGRMPNIGGAMPGGLGNIGGGMPNLGGGMPNIGGGMPNLGGGMPNMGGGMPNIGGLNGLGAGLGNSMGGGLNIQGLLGGLTMLLSILGMIQGVQGSFGGQTKPAIRTLQALSNLANADAMATNGFGGTPGGFPSNMPPGSYQPNLPSGQCDNSAAYRDQYARVYQALEGSPLIGQRPLDGAKYGITTGSREEWARFFTRLARVESGFNPNTAADINGRREGTLTSFGVYQMGQSQFNTFGGGNIYNANDNTRAFVRYAESMYFGTGPYGRGGGQNVIAGQQGNQFLGISAGYGPLRRTANGTQNANESFLLANNC